MKNIGIIGCGKMAEKRARALWPTQRVVALYDTDHTRAKHLAATLNARATPTLENFFAEPLDAVIIATPHAFLTGHTRTALKHGCHVLVEKPGAINAADLLETETLATSQQRSVWVGYNHRFHPALAKAHALVRQGMLGDLMFIRGRYGHGGRLGYEQEWRAQPELSGGGERIDQGSHLVDLAQWFLGPLTPAHHFFPTYFWNMPVEDNAFLALTTERGQCAWLHASWTEWKNLFSFEIMGRTGKLQIDGLGGSYGEETLTHYSMRAEMGPPAIEIFSFPGEDISWKEEWSAFMKAAETGSSTLTNAAHILSLLTPHTHAP